MELCAWIGKETVTVKDSPSFIVNRVVLSMLNEAALLAFGGEEDDDGGCDRAVTLCMNFPVGPFRLAEFVGLHVALAVLEHLYKAFGEKSLHLVLSLWRRSRTDSWA